MAFPCLKIRRSFMIELSCQRITTCAIETPMAVERVASILRSQHMTGLFIKGSRGLSLLGRYKLVYLFI